MKADSPRDVNRERSYAAAKASEANKGFVTSFGLNLKNAVEPLIFTDDH
jgi:hypothetical protein